MPSSGGDAGAVWAISARQATVLRIDPATDAIIEIASVDMVRGGGITNAIDTLVRPTKAIPPSASAIHHIIDEDVQNAPQLGDVIERFRGADYYVAHNCEFEQSFFAAQGIQLGPWICTYKSALRVWPDFEGRTTRKLRYALGCFLEWAGRRDIMLRYIEELEFSEQTVTLLQVDNHLPLPHVPATIDVVIDEEMLAGKLSDKSPRLAELVSAGFAEGLGFQQVVDGTRKTWGPRPPVGRRTGYITT
jgi:hypothetical protein